MPYQIREGHEHQQQAARRALEVREIVKSAWRLPVRCSETTKDATVELSEQQGPARCLRGLIYSSHTALELAQLPVIDSFQRASEASVIVLGIAASVRAHCAFTTPRVLNILLACWACADHAGEVT